MAFALAPAARAAGHELAAYEEIGSTNAEGLARLASGAVGPLWIVSPHQTAGRGRRARPWETPRGNLAATFAVRLDIAPAAAATLGFVAGLALCEALARIAPGLAATLALDGLEGHGSRLRLKWPNDVLCDGAKLAGILLEAQPTAAGIGVVTGIGVNIVEAPSALPYPATSLKALGIDTSAEAVFAWLSQAWVDLYAVWDGGRGFPAIRRLWLARAAGLGDRVAVEIGGRVLSGVFEDIDAEGRLLIRGRDGHVQAIAAGEVHFGVAATAGR